jgi:hypothetical protein
LVDTATSVKENGQIGKIMPPTSEVGPLWIRVVFGLCDINDEYHSDHGSGFISQLVLAFKLAMFVRSRVAAAAALHVGGISIRLLSAGGKGHVTLQ